jgi:HPt (histidine-containing phosphotransfer) domain-containing protein
MTTSVRELVTVDASFEPLVARFMSNRRTDVDTMRAALAGGDWRTLAATAHAVKGVGGTYGFDRVSEIASVIERAARRADADESATGLTTLSDYLARVEVTYA